MEAMSTTALATEYGVMQFSHEAPSTSFVIGLGVVLIAALVLGYFLLRHFFRETRKGHEAQLETAPRTENASAFMAASMQAVIQKLREQEKELERLHKQEKERAEQTERLSEEVTRNMPAGLLVINANGIISSANPASEQTLGESSDLTRLAAKCLATGQIFRREQVEYAGPDGAKKQLGVTISPIRRD